MDKEHDEWTVRFSDWLSEKFYSRDAKITIMIDEDREQSSYAICSTFKDKHKEHSRIERSGTGNIDDILDMAIDLQLHRRAMVICDCIPGGKLFHVARHYGWMTMTLRSHDFPFVGFICGLNR